MLQAHSGCSTLVSHNTICNHKYLAVDESSCMIAQKFLIENGGPLLKWDVVGTLFGNWNHQMSH